MWSSLGEGRTSVELGQQGPEGLRDFPKVTWIGKILGKSQKQRRERRAVSYFKKTLAFRRRTKNS